MDGTAALPSLTFALDPDTGIYRSATNELGLVTGGVLRVRIDGSGYLYGTGFVASDRFYSPRFADLGGPTRLDLTISGKSAYTATTTLTGGVDLGHAFFITTDFSAADKVLQWGDAATVELGAVFGDGSMQLDGVITSDGTGTSTFAGRVAVADGVDINTTVAQPTCAVGVRGLLWTVEGGAGVADRVEQCMKGTADTYAWKTIATAP